MDISGNIHCVLNNINKIILAQKLETFLTNILSRDIFVVANKKECEKIVKKMGNTNISNTAGYLIVTKNYQYYVYMTGSGLFSLFNNKGFKPYNLGA